MLPDLHTNFSRGRSGGLVFPSLSEFSTVYCDPHSQRLYIYLHITKWNLYFIFYYFLYIHHFNFTWISDFCFKIHRDEPAVELFHKWKFPSYFVEWPFEEVMTRKKKWWPKCYKDSNHMRVTWLYFFLPNFKSLNV